MAPTTKILTQPDADCQVPVYELTKDETDKMKTLRKYASTIQLPKTDAYHPWEHRWLDAPDTMLRYMRATKWRLEDAKKRLKSTIEWRRAYKPDLIKPEEVFIESLSGKMILNGFDKEGRPVLYVRPGRENTSQSPRQLRYLVWCLERAKDLMPPGQHSMVILIDYKSTTMKTNPSIAVARKALHILQDHYVETLGRCLVINFPSVFNFFYKGVSPFLDPVTRDKIRFNPGLGDLIPASNLDADFGGSNHYQFAPVDYWKDLVSVCGISEDGTRKNAPVVIARSPSATTLESEGTQESSTTRDSVDTQETMVDVVEMVDPVSTKLAEMRLDKVAVDEVHVWGPGIHGRY